MELSGPHGRQRHPDALSSLGLLAVSLAKAAATFARNISCFIGAELCFPLSGHSASVIWKLDGPAPERPSRSAGGLGFSRS